MERILLEPDIINPDRLDPPIIDSDEKLNLVSALVADHEMAIAFDYYLIAVAWEGNVVYIPRGYNPSLLLRGPQRKIVTRSLILFTHMYPEVELVNGVEMKTLLDEMRPSIARGYRNLEVKLALHRNYLAVMAKVAYIYRNIGRDRRDYNHREANLLTALTYFNHRIITLGPLPITKLLQGVPSTIHHPLYMMQELIHLNLLTVNEADRVAIPELN